MTERAASLDEDLIRRLSDRVPVPLVLHGSSGVPDAGIDGAIRAGMRKINIGTPLNVVFTAAVRQAPAADAALYDPPPHVRPARPAVAHELTHMPTATVNRHRKAEG